MKQNRYTLDIYLFLYIDVFCVVHVFVYCFAFVFMLDDDFVSKSVKWLKNLFDPCHSAFVL